MHPHFCGFLEDENGINTAKWHGHDIVAILDGDVSNPYLLNDYYKQIWMITLRKSPISSS
jgi:hypothetical protein